MPLSHASSEIKICSVNGLLFSYSEPIIELTRWISHKVILLWGGPRLENFVALNLHGPEIQCVQVEKSWQPENGMWASWRKLCSPVPTVLESICLSTSSTGSIRRGWNCYNASSTICYWTGHTAWILRWTQSISPVCWCLWNPSGGWRKGQSKHHWCVFHKMDVNPGTADDPAGGSGRRKLALTQLRQSSPNQLLLGRLSGATNMLMAGSQLTCVSIQQSVRK